jgi:hypothetical protein
LPNARIFNLYSISECHDVSGAELSIHGSVGGDVGGVGDGSGEGRSLAAEAAPSSYETCGRVFSNVEGRFFSGVLIFVFMCV